MPASGDEGSDGIHLVLLSDHGRSQGSTGLFLGTQRAAENADLLRRNQISSIVCVGTPKFHPEEFDYLEVSVLDIPSENLLAHFDACASFIDSGMRGGQGVLVNCVFAQSRSATGVPVVANLLSVKVVGICSFFIFHQHLSHR